MSLPRSPFRRRSQSGQAAVETALMIIPLLMVLLAIMDFSVAIFVMDTLEYAARQGVRYAITDQVVMTSQGPPAVYLNQIPSIRQAVRNNSLGILGANIPDSQITVTFYALDASDTWQPTTSNNGTLVKVGVTGFSWLWMLPGWMGSNALSINVASTDVMQGCPLGGCPIVGS
jgi:Flp pilus assembly protein TadG